MLPDFFHAAGGESISQFLTNKWIWNQVQFENVREFFIFSVLVVIIYWSAYVVVYFN